MEEVKVQGVQEGVLTLVLTGEIDFAKAEEFYEQVMESYRATPAHLRFACDGLVFIDSTTLGTFVKIMKVLKNDGKKVQLVGLQPKLKKLFVICALDTLMEIA